MAVITVESMRSLPRLAVMTGAIAGTLVGALVGALAVAPAPAEAAVAGSTSTSDVVLFDHCQRHPIHYSVDVPSGTSFWRLEVQLFDPKGDTSQGRVVTGATGSTSGTVEAQFCGSERTGTWTVRATGFTQTVPLVEVPFALPDTTFQVRPMATRTSLVGTALDHGRFRLTTVVLQHGERGFERANGIPSRLDRRIDGHWQRVAGLTLTTVRGRAVATVDSPGKYRAVVRPGGNYAASTSKPVMVG
jgi:hypothetical protein